MIWTTPLLLSLVSSNAVGIAITILSLLSTNVEGQATIRVSCGQAAELSCAGSSGVAITCLHTSQSWQIRGQVLAAASSWYRVNTTTCSLHVFNVTLDDAGVYGCCSNSWIGGSCDPILLVNITLDVHDNGQCNQRPTESPTSTSVTFRATPTHGTPLSAPTAPPWLTSTELILVLSAAGLLLIITIGMVFVCYQRYTLGKLRSTRHQEVSFHADRPSTAGYSKRMRSELRAANITEDPLTLTEFAADTPMRKKQRKRKMAYSYSEPKLQRTLQGQSGGGLRSTGMMGFDAPDGGIPSAYAIQNKAFSQAGFHNNYFRSMHYSDDDDFGDIDSVIRGVMSTPDERPERRNSQTLPKPKTTPLAKIVIEEEGSSPGEEKKPLVRHFSWHSPGGGFSATMMSGAEVSSPFQHFVSQRMVRHRSATTSPAMSEGPLTEEELEDMLTLDPEMSAVDHDTGTSDIDLQSD